VIYIYKLTCVSTGKSYIGFSNNPDFRWKHGHCQAATQGSKYMLHNAIRKYGPDSFKREILDEVDDSAKGLMETMYIVIFNTYMPNGYNMTIGGEAPPSPKGKPAWNRSRKCPEISVAKKGKPSPRKGIPSGRLGRPSGRKGKPSRRKGVPSGRKGIPLDSVHRQAISATLTGRQQAQITCPHCHKVGGNAMKMFHFDNCKQRQQP
jgi:group I intron endonuclease